GTSAETAGTICKPAGVWTEKGAACIAGIDPGRVDSSRLFRHVPALIDAFQHILLERQPLAPHVVHGPRATVLIARREALGDLQRLDIGLTRIEALLALLDQHFQRLAGSAGAKSRAHLLGEVGRATAGPQQTRAGVEQLLDLL